MRAGDALVGLWGSDVLDAPGGFSDELLVFKQDGTGYQEYVNVTTCYAWTFRWTVAADGRLHLEGQEALSLAKDCRGVDRSPSALVEAVSFSVRVEDIRRGSRARPMRVLELERPVNDFAGRFGKRFGYMGSDVDALQPGFQQG